VGVEIFAWGKSRCGEGRWRRRFYLLEDHDDPTTSVLGP
jgi:hypothetical protein